MRKAADSPLLRRFAAAAEGGEIIDSLKLIFRLTGGMPHERLDHSLGVDASGSARVRYEDRLKRSGPTVGQGTLSRAELMEFLKSIARAKDGLVFEDEALFIPDAVTGRVTVEIEGNKETYWFGLPSPDEDADDIEDDVAEGYHRAPQLSDAVSLFEQYSTRLLAAQRE